MDRANSVVRMLWIGLAVLVLSASGDAAEMDLSASMPFGPLYVPEAWTPLRIEVRNRETQLLDGSVRIIPTNPVAPEFRAPMRVPGQSRVRTTMWVQLPASNPKSADTPGVTLHDAQGARVQMSKVAGRSAVPSVSFENSGFANSGYLLAVVGAEARPTESDEPDNLSLVMAAAMDWKVSAATLDPSSAAQAGQLYDGAYLVMLTKLPPQSLDPSQRQALLDYVTTGGVLLLPNPDPAMIAGSWLEPYLPVRLIGQRQMNGLWPIGSSEPFEFAKWLPLTEATSGEGVTVWQDEQFVHAAYRTLGLGRIVFTSFPPGALEGSDQEVLAFWRNLLQMDRPPVGAQGSRVATDYGRLMEPMLGRKAASWSMAISAACAIVLLSVAAQLIWRGADRPKAFGVSLGVSVVLAAGFTAMSVFRQQSEPLQHASLTVADVSHDGSVAQQYAAFAGPQQQLSQVASNPLSTIHPVLLREELPLVREWPMSEGPISVAPEQVKQVTLAKGMLDGVAGSARAQFTQEGLRLDVENGIGAELGSAQLTWGPCRFSAGQFAPGASSRILTVADLRPPQEYASVSGVASQDQLHKGEIIHALVQSRENAPSAVKRAPLLVGFVDHLPALTVVDGAIAEHDARQNAVRMRVEVAESPAGSPVHIDGCFSRIVPGAMRGTRGLPYDAARHEFLRSPMTGAWSLCIEPPTEIGAIEPQHARVRIDLASPQHKITLRRGQCRDEKLKPDRNGPIVGQWANQVGLQTTDVTPQAGDFDSQGRLWFLLEVENGGAAGSLGVDPHWRIEQFQVDIDGKVRPK